MNGITRDSDDFLIRAGYGDFTAGAGETEHNDVPEPAYTIDFLDSAGKAHKYVAGWTLAVPPAPPKGEAANIVSGTYTGDGELTQSIADLSFQPEDLEIEIKNTVSGTDVETFRTWTDLVDDDAAGMCVHTKGIAVNEVKKDQIKSLDSNGFTVSDQGADGHPNKQGIVYNYKASGCS